MGHVLNNRHHGVGSSILVTVGRTAPSLKTRGFR